MFDMYDLLLQLPLFQGLNRNRLDKLIEKTKFEFVKYPAKSRIISKNETCTHLKFLVSGKIRTEITNNNGKIHLNEELSAPNVIAPNYLFGIRTYYPFDIFAVEDTGIMQVDKKTFISLMQQEDIFLLNTLNITSNQSQRKYDSLSFLSSNNMIEKFASWILNFTNNRSENVQIICRQRDLYSFFGVQRSVFIHAMNELESRNIIKYTNKWVTILDRYSLQAIVKEQQEKEKVE